MTTIDIHAARIESLLEAIGSDRASETLLVTPAALSADPWAYDTRVLARTVVATTALPRFDNSQMDGYAVRAADLTSASAASPVRLDVTDPIPAGEAARTHVAGTATPIMTGSPLPPGADAVVKIEDARPPRFPAAGDDHVTEFVAPVSSGVFVRTAGSDLADGDVLLEKGTVLRAVHYGVLAAAGVTEVEVERRLRVLIVPTGNEIRQPGETLAEAQIHDANGMLLASAVRECGAVAIVDPCESDDASELLSKLSGRLRSEHVDVVVTIGGVSAGAYEVVRDALAPLGATFGHVDMQPGGPQGYGLLTFDDGATHVPVISFPGNPVSALISFEVFLRAPLRRSARLEPADRPRVRAVLTEPLDSPVGLHQLRRATLAPDATVTPMGGPSSHLLHHFARSNAVLPVPVGTDRIESGADVEIWRIDG